MPERRIVPDDIASKAVHVFRDGDRYADEAAGVAMLTLFDFIETGRLTFTMARSGLADEEKISNLIERARKKIEQDKNRKYKEYDDGNWELLTATSETSEKIAADQEAMRAEFKSALDKLGDKLSTLSDITADLHGASKEVAVRTDAISAASTILITSVDRVVAGVQQAVRNTSTRTAVIVGLTVGTISGIPIGILSNYLYAKLTQPAAANANPPQAARPIPSFMTLAGKSAGRRLRGTDKPPALFGYVAPVCLRSNPSVVCKKPAEQAHP
jgi:hypothetical protein